MKQQTRAPIGGLWLPALAMLLFALGSFLCLELRNFGLIMPDAWVPGAMWAMFLLSGLMQMSVAALLLLPPSAMVFGAAVCMQAQALLRQAKNAQGFLSLAQLLVIVPLYFLFFCRGMTQGGMLWQQLLSDRRLGRREIVLSFFIMFGSAALYWLFRSFMDRY